MKVFLDKGINSKFCLRYVCARSRVCLSACGCKNVCVCVRVCDWVKTTETSHTITAHQAYPVWKKCLHPPTGKDEAQRSTRGNLRERLPTGGPAVLEDPTLSSANPSISVSIPLAVETGSDISSLWGFLPKVPELCLVRFHEAAVDFFFGGEGRGYEMTRHFLGKPWFFFP